MTDKPNLVDVAKDIENNRGKTRPAEEVELAVAWAKGEVSTSSVSKALNLKGASTYVRLAFLLKDHIKKSQK